VIGGVTVITKGKSVRGLLTALKLAPVFTYVRSGVGSSGSLAVIELPEALVKRFRCEAKIWTSLLAMTWR
jgi:hypothetical protein